MKEKGKATWKPLYGPVNLKLPKTTTTNNLPKKSGCSSCNKRKKINQSK